MCENHDCSIMTGLWFVVRVHYILEYTASNNSLYRVTKLPKPVLRCFLHSVCTCLGNRSTIQAIFVPFKKMTDLEGSASMIHPKQVHHLYASMILFSLFEGQLHISRSKENSSLFNDCKYSNLRGI